MLPPLLRSSAFIRQTENATYLTKDRGYFAPLAAHRTMEFKRVPSIAVAPFKFPFTSVAPQVHLVNYASTNGSRAC